MRVVFLLVVVFPLLSFGRGAVCFHLFPGKTEAIETRLPDWGTSAAAYLQIDSFVRKEYFTESYLQNDIRAFEVLEEISKRSGLFKTTPFTYSGKTMLRPYVAGETLIDQMIDLPTKRILNTQLIREFDRLILKIEKEFYNLVNEGIIQIKRVNYIRNPSFYNLPSLQVSLENQMGDDVNVWLKGDNIVRDRDGQFIIFDPF